MKQSAAQVVFVALALLAAALILHRGRPTLFSPAPAHAQFTHSTGVLPAQDSDRTAAIAVILAQLRAFRQNDYRAASLYQTPGMSNKFTSAHAFRHMMERYYPAFLHYKEVMFGPCETPDNGQHIRVPLSLLMGDGTAVPAVYLMMRRGGPGAPAYSVLGVQGGTTHPPIAAPATDART